jgi:probable HAF family extracellular repeat protein
VGMARHANGQGHAAVFHGGGVVTDLGTLGGTDSIAYGVNSSGQIVGRARNAQELNRAFIYQNGVMTSLGTLGGTGSVGEAINDAGSAVGYAQDVNDQFRGFVYSAGVMTSIGTLGGNESQALDINNAGQVVGFARNASGNPRAIMYENGVLMDLNTLLPAGSGWSVLEIAHEINDSGWIVGEGTYLGRHRAFLMIVPSPSVLPVLLAGLGLVSRRSTRGGARGDIFQSNGPPR